MKTLPLLVLTLVVFLGFGGCSLPHGQQKAQPPAVIINPPDEHHPCMGSGCILVRLNPDSPLPPAAAKKAMLFIDGVPHPFGEIAHVKSGKHAITFNKRPIPGLLTPPAQCVNVSRLKTTTVIVSYNRELEAHNFTGSQGYVVESYPIYATARTGFLDCTWTPAQAGLAAQWWLLPQIPHDIHAPPAQRGYPTAAGNTTMTFGPLSGYVQPAPTGVHVYKGYTTEETVTYGQ